jgi:hypothetical protein
MSGATRLCAIATSMEDSKGTEALFSIYFPPKEQYQGRFFQHITPTPGSEKEGARGSVPDNKVGFSIASGAYFVETTGRFWVSPEGPLPMGIEFGISKKPNAAVINFGVLHIA